MDGGLKVPCYYAQRDYACARWGERFTGGVSDIGCCCVAGTMGFARFCWDEGAGGEKLVVWCEWNRRGEGWVPSA
jgi:hypothetical protein